MNWEHGFVLTAGLCGLIFCIVAFILSKFPPKKINHLYGYRTAKSMSSQQRWDFAQTFSAKRMMESGMILLILALIAAFTIPEGVYSQTGSYVALGLILGCAGYIFLRTERVIDKKFKE